MTGGTVKPSESFFYVLDYKIKQSGDYRMKTIAETPGEMCIQNADLSIDPIDRLECSTAKKLMGCSKSWMEIPMLNSKH